MGASEETKPSAVLCPLYMSRGQSIAMLNHHPLCSYETLCLVCYSYHVGMSTAKHASMSYEQRGAREQKTHARSVVNPYLLGQTNSLTWVSAR